MPVSRRTDVVLRESGTAGRLCWLGVVGLVTLRLRKGRTRVL